MITKEDALTCQEFHHVSAKNADGTPLRVRASGKCRVWKRTPNAFKLPVKYGLYGNTAITETNSHEWNTGDGR